MVKNTHTYNYLYALEKINKTKTPYPYRLCFQNSGRALVYTMWCNALCRHDNVER